MSAFAEALARTIGPSLENAGFTRGAVGWTRQTGHGLNALSVFEDGDWRVVTFGWQFTVLGDPEPSPADARGCARRMPLDAIAPANDLRSLTLFPGEDSAAMARWAQRLTVAWNRAAVPWLERWARPDGFRDYASQRGFHVTAAWISACLGHAERARRELELAHVAAAAGLDGEFDRAAAEHDAAMAAPFAARHGLGAYLARAEVAGNETILEVFTQRRGQAAQTKITTPEVDHRRLQHRRAVFAELCREYIDAPRGAVT